MRGIPLALAAALAVSLAFNLAFYRRSAAEDAAPEAKPRATSSTGPSPSLPAAAPASTSGHSSQLLAELRQLRAELAASRGTPSTSPSASASERPALRKAPEEFSPAIAQDPVVMNALAERDLTRQASSRFWRDLDRVYEVKDAIGVPKFREVMARLTADFLGLNASTADSFVFASTQAVQELDRAEADRKETEAKLKAVATDRDTRKRLEDGMETRYAEQKQSAYARLDPFLRGTMFQLDQKGKQGGRWMEYFRGR
jgi:hypothetical protein